MSRSIDSRSTEERRAYLPASTQWEIVEEAAELLKPVYEELVHQAAQADLEYVDDTRARILEVQREPDDERTGVSMTAMVAGAQGRQDRPVHERHPARGRELHGCPRAPRTQSQPGPSMSDALNHNKPDVNDGPSWWSRTVWRTAAGSLSNRSTGFPTSACTSSSSSARSTRTMHRRESLAWT